MRFQRREYGLRWRHEAESEDTGLTAGPVFVGLRGHALTDEEREFLQHPQVGGVVLFARNYAAPEQLAALVESVHALREALLVCVDHEGGRVQRFTHGFTELPAASRLGQRHDADPVAALGASESLGRLMALELRAVGIDVDFAPVVDLANPGSELLADRTFHADAAVVTALAGRCLRGMHAGGLAGVAKHFPGHGGVEADSHTQAPVDDRELADLEMADLIPYQRLVGDGLEAVMVSHVRYPRIDERPAGFSPFWLRRVLRGRLGFEGAIISDDLQMAAAAWAGGLEDRVEAALEAGCDAVLICQNPAGLADVLDRLGDRADPVGRLRLARLRGRRPGPSWNTLRRDPLWQRLRRAVTGLVPPPEPELPLFTR